MISVLNKKAMTSGLSTLTRAPITPSAVNLKYSKGLVLLTVLRKGYKKIGIWAAKKAGLVSWWAATHWNKAKTLQALFEVRIFNFGGR